MALPLVDVLIFPAPQAFDLADAGNPANLSLNATTAPIFKNIAGSGSIFYGVGVKDPMTGYIFATFDNGGNHPKAAIASLIAHLKPTRSCHVQFSSDTFKTAFKTPITEVLVLIMIEPDNREKAVQLLSKIAEASGGVLSFAPDTDDENTFVIFGGWESVEAHMNAYNDLPEGSKTDLRQLFSLAKIVYPPEAPPAYAKLQRYEPLQYVKKTD
ncbi:hypothetical protein BJ138DRAFT_1099304 [Hygrophoropsis aurantiaca]|uniref:Uncharacterized protein n=1 Tax=Hygrophoropsis aurantiaca TaxID=72124 RepID=A0ACB8AK10_9AGAM|nr:hypothetical protein BJ138DRAFT_1099304 [Hygrophoropsis aurantiaca]